MSYTAIILAAGSGSRLGRITAEQPKCMVQLQGRPFLELLILKLFREQCEKVIVVVGHRADIIIEHIKHSQLASLNITTVYQTGGEGTLPALLSGFAQAILCLNADTILDINYGAVMDRHRQSGWDATLVTTELADVPNRGAIEIDSSDRVISFREGQSFQISNSDDYRSVSNCGCYGFSVDTLCYLTALSGRHSLETECLPLLAQERRVGSFSNGQKLFLDFGTPERLRRAMSLPRDVMDRIYHLG